MSSSDEENTKPIYFWRLEDENAYLGQWYLASFVWQNGKNKFSYANAEQYMMHRKSLLFAGPDHPMTQRLQAGWKLHPRKLRDLGRQIPGLDETVWQAERYAIVAEGTYLKFKQNPDIAAPLLATGTGEIVEASPSDRIWGVGFGRECADLWREEWGMILLGEALMEARTRLRDEKRMVRDAD
ncbi:NADAR family protein [Aspergillus homomorphus CBS 101889]|uniref:DUF1768-domain-containing protein n=1 Tax=Aspergillus homomorphus (strain CBS 101889) TaxID=1450537 RepID=A0A395HSF3_ASPHC|nr:DUF1768-domain-containing protein [Aspergillus homomorphus CBS 101889]RAL10710.1 DUF1768-domain-containing protein [Aspergillus homomorphus CBS 101889]